MGEHDDEAERAIIAACAREPEHDIGNARRFLKWAGDMCMSQEKGHGFKACTYHFSPDNCPFSG